MTAPFPSLVRFYAKTFYGLGGAQRASGIKGILKKVGIAVLAVVVVADVSVIFVGMYLAMYKALKSVGLEDLLLLNAATTASMIVFVLGFVTALSTYYLSQAESALLAMPIKPRHLLGAKMISVYLSEFALAFVVIAIAAGIYGAMERPSAGFYLAALVSALAAPLLPLAAAYLLLVPLMTVARPLRNKNAMMVVGGLLGTVAAVLFNIYIQSSLSGFALPAQAGAGAEALYARFGTAYPPAYLAWKSLTAGGAAAALHGLGNLALGLAAAALVAVALGPAYASSLHGFEEQRLKRRLGGIDRGAFKRRPAALALFLREWRLMNREPVYFLNGPFAILIMPIVMGVMFLVQRESLDQLLVQIGAYGGGPGPFLAAAAFGGFLGSSTSIACTALSRDAKALPYIKALPIRYEAYVGAKLAHALAFSATGSALGGIGVSLLVGLGAAATMGAAILAFAFCAFVAVAGLWLDIANPRMAWDTPTAALKQNPNAVISILGTMALIGALGALSGKLGLGTGGFFALYGGVFGAVAIAGAALLPRYARRRLGELEA